MPIHVCLGRKYDIDTKKKTLYSRIYKKLTILQVLRGAIDIPRTVLLDFYFTYF